MGYAPVSITQATPGMNKEIKIPGFGQEEGQAQGPGGLLPAVRHDDQLRPVAAAGADHPDRADREQGARARPGRGPQRHRDRQLAVGRRWPSTPTSSRRSWSTCARAGEVGGFLDTVLLQIAENYEAEVKLRGKVKAAMTYPVVVFVHRHPAVIGMLIFIVPIFASAVRRPRRHAAAADPGPGRPVQGAAKLAHRSSDRRWSSSRPGRGSGSSTSRGCATSSTRSSSSCRSSACCSRRSR